MLWVPSPFTTLQQSSHSLVSDTFSKDISYGDVLQLDTAHPHPPQEWHRFCSFLGVTCTKRQQFSTRRFGKAEAHPTASGATALPPSSLWEAPPSPTPPASAEQGSCSSLCSSLLSQPVPVPSWQAACEEGKGKERLF